MEQQVRSAKAYSDSVTALAHAKAGKEVPETHRDPVPLVPIYIGVDREPQEPLREMFLYRHGDPQWSVRPAASRFLLETGMPGNYEKVLADQINAGLRPYANWKDPGREQLVKFELFVRRGDEVFRDELVWDVSNPQNTADTYAIRVCADLGLSCDWYDAITANLKSRIEEVRKDLQEHPDDVQLEQPVTQLIKRQRTSAPAAEPQPAAEDPSEQQQGQQEQQQAGESRKVGVPRLEPYDPSNDVEAARVAARQQVMQIRANMQQQQPGLQQPAGAPQQQQCVPGPAAIKSEQQQHQQQAQQPAAQGQQIVQHQAVQQIPQQQVPTAGGQPQVKQEQKPEQQQQQQQQQQPQLIQSPAVLQPQQQQPQQQQHSQLVQSPAVLQPKQQQPQLPQQFYPGAMPVQQAAQHAATMQQQQQQQRAQAQQQGQPQQQLQQQHVQMQAQPGAAQQPMLQQQPQMQPQQQAPAQQQHPAIALQQQLLQQQQMQRQQQALAGQLQQQQQYAGQQGTPQFMQR